MICLFTARVPGISQAKGITVGSTRGTQEPGSSQSRLVRRGQTGEAAIEVRANFVGNICSHCIEIVPNFSPNRQPQV